MLREKQNLAGQGAAPAGDNKVIGINQDGTHLGLTVAISNVTITGGKNSFVSTGNFQETGDGRADIIVGESKGSGKIAVIWNFAAGNPAH